MERIGHYRIIEEMGRGGMGVVYKGYEESLSRFVAIKVLGEHLTSEELFVKRFQREAQAAARISHPHIVPIYYVGEDAGRHYFAMEYLTGGSLEGELRRSGRVEPQRAARWMLETARGLAAAHAEGLIHRDIKPANLMLDGEGHVKIADFGLALATTQATRLTGTGLFLGSPGYLSPEQCRGEELDGRSDVYSLGVAFYELLSGRIPFSGDSPAALVLNIVQTEPPPIEGLNPDVPPELRRILGRMMAKSRDARYPAARDLARDLEAFLLATGRRGLADTVASSSPTRLRAADEVAPTAVLGGPTRRLEEAVADGGGSPDSTVPGAAATVVASAPAAAVPAAAATPARSRRSRLLPIAALILVGVALAAGGAGWALWTLFKPALQGQAVSRSVTDLLPAFLKGNEAPLLTATRPEADGSDPEASAEELEPHVAEPPQADATLPATVTAPSTSDEAQASQHDAALPVAASPAGGETRSVSPPVETRPAVSTPTAAPGSVAVVVLGERLLAGSIEQYLEERLVAHGHVLVDAMGSADGLALFQGGQDPSVEEIVRLLRARAATLVLARVEYLDERHLTYLGRGDTAYRSRVSIRALDLGSGEAQGAAVVEEVEYTALSAERAVRDTLGAAVRRFLAEL